jgi:hypothetical protein
MPSYQNYPETGTIASNTEIGYWLSWENIPGVGPNQGPLLIGADPVSHQSAEVILAIYDVQKCRRAPPSPAQQNAPGATQVFYQFNIKNFSTIPALYGFELIDFSDLM